MIITETPFRVSFFGGGTDYPEYFESHGGAVLGTAIDKYAYFAITDFLSKLFEYNIRLAYSKVETVTTLEEIEHAPFRESLRWCGVERDVEVSYTAELPSFSGLGTSSSFVVGLLNSLYAYQGKHKSPLELAYEAIRLERDILGDSVGCQDQAFAALGGFNVLEFRRQDDILVHRVPLSHERMSHFEDHLMLVFTGLRRRAGEVAKKQINRINQNLSNLKRMREMVDEGYAVLAGTGSLSRFGELLHEAWVLKSQLESSISNDIINDIYHSGLEAGALGGKLLGAGGGGFILFFVPPEKRQAVRNRLAHLQEIAIRVNAPGSHVIHHQPSRSIIHHEEVLV